MCERVSVKPDDNYEQLACKLYKCLCTSPPVVTTQRLQSFPVFRTGCLEYLEDQAITSRYLVAGNSSQFIYGLGKTQSGVFW